ncbi:saccharopine dehydrogenase NADP-binding domain-containing protein [Zobellella sp. DQSA1]|uniref:saccharopine dehydrogenase NADP-binding domain-containing protein n=1 Tax=Zobellella sp. DQSA1 TaxID=3342386 RepID=UPI0035C0EF37
MPDTVPGRCQRILIVGGYGHVGRRIARYLQQWGKWDLTLAGRAPEKVRMVGVASVRLDLADPDSWDLPLASADVVVVTMDQTSGDFARRVLAEGKRYLDITADIATLRAIEALDQVARQTGAVAVLSVGFAPGLTNLLARACASRLEQATAVHIGVRLGMGDAHGVAAIDWVLKEATHAAPPRSITFAPDHPPRPAWPFPFADQYAVAKTLGVPAETFLSLDPSFLARLAFRFAPLLAGREQWRRRLARLMTYVRIGSDHAELVVKVTGIKDRRPHIAQARYQGRKEADITALVAALAVAKLAESPPMPGVCHLDELLSLGDILDPLTEAGGRVELDVMPAPQTPPAAPVFRPRE